MDLTVKQSLHETIEKLTHSGTPFLDREMMKKLKTLCKQHSDPCLRAAYQMVSLDLAEDHAEVRLSAFQVIKELFTRSNLFRELLIADFKTFSSLVTGTDPLSPLPPPKEAAEQLKKTSLLAIKEWNQKYGRGYPKLKLGYNYLKFNRKVDFVKLVADTEAERKRKQERETRQKTILNQRIQEVKQEMMSLKQEIEASLIEVDSCFNLILPRFEMPDIYTSARIAESALITVHVAESGAIKATLAESAPIVTETGRKRKRTDSSCSFISLSEGSGIDEGSGLDVSNELRQSEAIISDSDELSSSDSESSVEWEDVDIPSSSRDDGDGDGVELLQEHGIVAHGFSIPVEVTNHVDVLETEDNSSILATLEERRKQLIHHYLPSISKCLEWMVKAGEQDNVLQAIDLKDKVNKILSKYDKLNITFKDTPLKPEPHTEVKGHGTAPVVTDPEWKFAPNILESDDVELDPTTLQAQLAKMKKKHKILPPPSGPSKKKVMMGGGGGSLTSDLLSVAPVVPFGMDLYHWDEPSSSVEPRMLATIGSLHRFWAEEKEVIISQDEQNRLKCRTISFPGEFKPIKTSCRAKLPNGKLCLRKDRYKCPFHGTIIPRDEYGNPLNDHQGQDLGPPPQSAPLWQDQQILESVMDAKGIDLHIKDKRKKKGITGKRKEFPGLTDLTVATDTPRKRLERKVLSKRSLKRVAEGEDKLTEKKFSDKFGNNFNYAMKN